MSDKITLTDLEMQARQEQERSRAVEELTKEIQALLEQAESAGMKRLVIKWLVAEGLDEEGLQDTLEVRSYFYFRDYHIDCTLKVPEHMSIEFSMFEDNGLHLANHNRRPWSVITGDKHKNLGYALVQAAALWQWRKESDERQKASKAKAEQRREAAEREAIERGARYLQLLEEHPILAEMLDILAIYVEGHEQFHADLETAEEHAHNIEQQMTRKLTEANNEIAQVRDQVTNLQRDLWCEQDARRDAERKAKRGW